MGASTGPRIITDGLIYAVDSYANIRGHGPYYSDGVRMLRNIVNKNTVGAVTTIAELSGSADSQNYTMIGITYPESSYTPASRDGITPGFNAVSGTKTYDLSRDLNYFVFLEDSNTWLANSYFNGERINGHCYDTYDGQPDQHLKFQQDFNTINIQYPDATHIIIGSHAAENNDNDSTTLAILQSLGLPDSHIGVARPEYVLVGKLNKPHTQHYLRENLQAEVVQMNVRLPLEGKGGAMTFDGTDDIINTGLFSGRNPSLAPFTVECVIRSHVTANARMWVDTGSNYTNQRFYAALATAGSGNPLGIQGTAWSHSTPQNTLWTHQVVVMDGTTARIYHNGTEHSTRAYTSFTLGGDIRFGGRSGYMWDGNIGLFKVYEKALTANEVKINFNAYKNRFGI